MRRGVTLFELGLVAFVLIGGTAGAAAAGGCAYDRIPGVATIVDVSQTPESMHQASVGGGPGYEGYEVRYLFAPSVPVTDAGALAWNEGTHLIRLMNSWYPGPLYLEKYDLRPGKTFTAALMTIVQGTCTPYMVELEGVDPIDYFESPK